MKNKYNQDSYSKNKNKNKNKVYRLYFPDKCITTDFFPINMTPVDIILAIDEAYDDLMTNLKNGKQTKHGYSKTYNLNILILTNNNKIYNAYPPKDLNS